jgi:hypothetical protein
MYLVNTGLPRTKLTVCAGAAAADIGGGVQRKV